MLAKAARAVLALSLVVLCGGYTIPPVSKKAPVDENYEILRKMSKGVAAIAKQANQAIVFVSVYKSVQGVPYGMIDPFEFFFGPGKPGEPREQGPGGPRGGDRPQKKEGGLGSGFFIDLKKGYIITNNHVVQGADEIQLKLANGQTLEGKVVGHDPNTDVAVVQVKKDGFDRSGLSELTLGDSDTLEVGDFVVALGAPFGLEASLSFGVVSAVGRGNLDIAKLGNFIQTDAAINPGNSGGPLLDMHGQVCGMNTAIYSRSGGYNGIGFAVPANLVRTVAEQLINDGYIRRGYLGVFLQPIDEELHAGLNLPTGVRGGALVARVAPDSPAARAGIEAGDVITEVNGTPMKVHSEIVNAIGLMKPGSNVTLTIYREGKKKAYTVKIDTHPEDAGAGGGPKVASAAAGAGGDFGMTTADYTKALGQKYGLESKDCVVVTAVSVDGAADHAGLKAGDCILKVDGKKLGGTAAEFNKLTKSKGRVLVYIERAGEYYFQHLRKE